jgi:hypothetical protein
MGGIELIDGAGHWVQQEQPVRLSTLLLAFIKKVGGADHTSDFWTWRPLAALLCAPLMRGAKRTSNAERFAVGTLIAERPPHRSVRAVLPHTAPTSGV